MSRVRDSRKRARFQGGEQGVLVKPGRAVALNRMVQDILSQKLLLSKTWRRGKEVSDLWGGSIVAWSSGATGACGT